MTARLAGFLPEIFGWREYRVFSAPSAFYPPVDQFVANAAEIRPFGHGDASPPAFQKYACALVPGLLCFGRPIAVLRAVRAVVVSTLNRVCWRRREVYISQKVIELKPSFTNVDTPAAVISEVLGGRVGAACPQALPGVVFLRRFLPIFAGRVTVPQISRPVLLSVKAAAGFCVAALKGTCLDGRAIPTVAKAKPRDTFADVFRAPNDGQAIEFLTGQVNELWHFVTSKWVTVMGAWRSAVNSFSGATLAKQSDTTGGAAW